MKDKFKMAPLITEEALEFILNKFKMEPKFKMAPKIVFVVNTGSLIWSLTSPIARYKPII
jgi:hypothetical protein